ncbi:Zinc/iron permease [Emericellopsis atlantica]|uniref:Zinc/iron permease n=1 Tax=Emericellopsis atlantica TaxID=2614577 RepID=A0A9P8CNW7_9HYPO|nr:Zinc/iron permease [Emericellopsis atlantica]KAG9253933.1 Zinc/iron permease [Emericellopsis atlantica]
MAAASFLAGAVPLTFTLTSSQLRLLSALGVGVLVGTSMIVIIPEGIGAVASPSEGGHTHRIRSVARRSPWDLGVDLGASLPKVRFAEPAVDMASEAEAMVLRRDDDHDHEREHEHEHDDDDGDEHDHAEFPSFEVGISLILGFVLMFLIDRLPRHASSSRNSVPATLHISLDNLNGNAPGSPTTSSNDVEATSGGSPPARSMATTLGLVIHAAADGIAMGASSTTEDTKLSLVIFFAIMIHKAPAAFGLTSVLLQQGLSKRAARAHLIVFSLAAPVGAVATWTLVTMLGGGGGGEDSNWWTGMLLLFSGGTFLYVAMHAMQESEHGGHESHGSNGYTGIGGQAHEKPQGPQMRDTLVTVVGMLLPLLTQFGRHHH